eukprot:CAMPEP_0197469390 /NCGR_PEP_ID=MMETSP1175-20131217/66580_1 /TAXON_ID=1003142 /ORGANISM="Triceratium dubium, Strain CCMP147" /LENGTH=236 /DNA_ID=CAMNT_0043005533 /DNA_START=117 /DNA_END=824 /DNA_ORIENTATION=-
MKVHRIQRNVDMAKRMEPTLLHVVQSVSDCLGGGRSLTRKKLCKKICKTLRKMDHKGRYAMAKEEVMTSIDMLLNNGIIKEADSNGHTEVRYSLSAASASASALKGMKRPTRGRGKEEQGSVDLDGCVTSKEGELPIAELMRRRNTAVAANDLSGSSVVKAQQRVSVQEVEAADLDEEIRRLEDDLAEDVSSSDDSDCEHDITEDDSRVGVEGSFQLKPKARKIVGASDKEQMSEG